MSDWYDEDGNSLGEWEPCTEKHYEDVLDKQLGDARTVFAGRTQMGDDQEHVRNQVIVTEWGREGDDAPVVRCERTWDAFGVYVHVDYQFVRSTS